MHHAKLFYQSSVTNSVHSKEKQFTCKYALIRQYTENMVVTVIFSGFVYDIVQALLRNVSELFLKALDFKYGGPWFKSSQHLFVNSQLVCIPVVSDS